MMDKLQTHYRQVADEEYPECEGCKRLGERIDKLTGIVRFGIGALRAAGMLTGISVDKTIEAMEEDLREEE